MGTVGLGWRVEGGRIELLETAKCREGCCISQSSPLCITLHVASRPASSSGLGAPEILPLGQAWEQAQSFALPWVAAQS